MQSFESHRDDPSCCTLTRSIGSPECELWFHAHTQLAYAGTVLSQDQVLTREKTKNWHGHCVKLALTASVTKEALKVIAESSLSALLR